MAADAPAPAPRSTEGSPSRSPRPDPAGARTWVYVSVIVAVIVVVAGSAYFLTGGFHRATGNSSAKVLVANGTAYSITPGQYNAVAFIVSGNASVNGTMYTAYGMILYRMTVAQYEHLVITLNFSAGWEWTSGTIGNNTVYQLNLPVPAGQWELVWANPNAVATYITTLIGFYSNLVLTPD